MKERRFPVSAIIIWIIVVILIMIIIGYSITQNGIIWDRFAVDNEGRVYIAKTGRLDVIEAGQKVKELNVPTSRGFQFTIENGNVILVDTGTKQYTLDLNGNVLAENELPSDFRTYDTGKLGSFTDVNGLTYKKSSSWGRLEIVLDQNGLKTAVYQMPIKDYLMRMMTFIALIGLCYVIIATFRWKYRR